MSTGLRAAALRLPVWAREIEHRIATDGSFAGLCDALSAAEGALSRVDQLPEPVREDARKVYDGHVESLVREIEDALRRTKGVPIASAERPEGEEFQGQQELERSLILVQIARLAADAKASNSIINAGRHAARLFADFPHANWHVARIIDEIVHAATEARVAVELGPDH
jgi:hypothetical protein